MTEFDISPAETPASRSPPLMNRAPLFLLYLNVLVIATCGLIYELLAGTLASYVLGDSVTQFSLVIGTYLFALGIGAWISRFITRRLARAFIEVELAVALIGGSSAPLLFLAFGYVSGFQFVLFAFVIAIGTLVGLELPLLMRILQGHVEFSDLVSRVLAFDYIGALAASLMFPLLLVPQLGLVRTSLLFGICNALVGFWGTYLLRPLLAGSLGGLRLRAIVVIAILGTGMVQADRLTNLAEERQFGDPIVFARTSPYQRIVITQGPRDFHLFLNGNLQFHSADEYRYHEALVHPPMIAATNAARILVLGGGDGLAVREVLKHPSVRQVTLVDIDPAMTDVGAHWPALKQLNRAAFSDPRVELIHEDALVWLDQEGEPFDVVIIDFPDPSNFALGKLYTTAFYQRLKRRLKAESRIAIQCTSPLSAPKSYWCVVRTLEAAGYFVRPYHASVPSFGEWGYVLASLSSMESPREVPAHLAGQLRFLDNDALGNLFEMPPDMPPQDVEVNRWNNQMLVRYYESEWR